MDLEELKENFTDFLAENSRKTILICSILIFMTLCAVVVVCVNDSKSGKKETAPEVRKLVLDQELLIPDGPEVPEGYITERKTEKNWNENEIKEWFTVPDEEEIKKLGEANDKIVDEIIGAAP